MRLIPLSTLVEHNGRDGVPGFKTTDLWFVVMVSRWGPLTSTAIGTSFQSEYLLFVAKEDKASEKDRKDESLNQDCYDDLDILWFSRFFL